MNGRPYQGDERCAPQMKKLKRPEGLIELLYGVTAQDKKLLEEVKI
jgi:hypothetical protein